MGGAVRGVLPKRLHGRRGDLDGRLPGLSTAHQRAVRGDVERAAGSAATDPHRVVPGGADVDVQPDTEDPL